VPRLIYRAKKPQERERERGNSHGKLLTVPSSLRIHDSGLVTVGDRVLFAPNVTILTETHDKDVQSRRDGIVFTRPVSVGDDCWIGAGATILAGVTIGKGCTIGAGAVVTRDIPAFSVAYGIPARVVQEVADPDVSDEQA
jgi:acetyltransferase-like isoleucine patch superfamily enzyme